jgi:hypothetical protein
MLLLLNQNLYKWRTTSIVWCVGIHRQGLFIGVPGAVTDLIKSVIHQVMAGRPSHVADRPSSAASTDSRTRVPFHCLLESITAKETHGSLQSGAGPHPLVPHISGLCTWPHHVKCISGVTFILFEFLISL